MDEGKTVEPITAEPQQKIIRLTGKQNKFCEEYVVDLSPKQAALRAGYAPKNAATTACELLKKPHVMERIDELLAEGRERNKLTVDRVIQELCRIAFLDVRKIFDEEGDLRPVHELDEDTARAIAGVDVTRLADGRTKTKVRTIDKSKALELLARHLGLFVDRIQHEGNVGQVVIMIPDNQREGGVVDAQPSS